MFKCLISAANYTLVIAAGALASRHVERNYRDRNGYIGKVKDPTLPGSIC